MAEWIRLLLAIFFTYRLAYMFSSEEGPYLGLWKDIRQTGVFEWLRMKWGVEDIGPDGQPEKNFPRGLSCPLCVGVWVSVLTVILVAFPTPFGDILLLLFGIAGAQIFLERLGS